MPSGSHGGGAGSHSSGGSSFGGGSSFSGGGHSSRGEHSHFGGRTFIFFGRPTRLSGGWSVLSFFLTAILCFSIVSMIAGFCIIPVEKDDIKKIEEDYAYYQELINLGYTTTAKVTDTFSKFGKYYITYTIDIPNSSIDLEGYSYCVYTMQQAFALLNTEIPVAVNCPVSEISLTTDSVPLDYKDMPIERDGEYVQAVKGVKTARIFAYGSLATIVVAIGLNALIVKLNSNKAKKETTPSTTSTSLNKKPKHCSYCGAIVDENQKSCLSCGSRIHKL